MKQRILVIKLGALGDFILAMGPFKAIRHHHAGAHITLLTTPPYAELGHACGYFDEILPIGRPAKRDLSGLWRLIRALRQGRFDRVYDLQTSTRSSFYRHFIPGAEWSGIARGCSHPHANPNRSRMHSRERQAEQLAMAGIDAVPPPDLSWGSADISHFNLPASGYALLVPGGSAHRPEKRWPVEHYAELAFWLMEQGVRPLILGSGAEQELAESIEARCPEALSLVDRTNFQEIITLARHAKLAIGNDTGPMHLIAAADGCPCLVLFSAASDPARCAPRGENVIILQRDPLASLSVGEVTSLADLH